MKAMKKDLRAVITGLRILARKTEKIEKELGKVSVRRGIAPAKNRAVLKTRAADRRSQGRALASRGRGLTATDAVLGVIRKGGKGVTTTQIKVKTGFDDKKIWNVINRLKTQRKIKSARRGIYVTRGK